MNNNYLEHFGDYLMRSVRDVSIEHWDAVLSGRMKDRKSQELYSIARELSDEANAFARELIPQIVDHTIHSLLQSLDEEDSIKVAVILASGQCENIGDISDGLAGELYTDRGWIKKFSRERSA